MNLAKSGIKSSPILHLLFAVVFITSGLIVNFFQALLYIFVNPFNQILYKKILYYVTYGLNCHITFLVQWWSDSSVILYIDEEHLQLLGKENAFLMVNHCYEIDWLVGWVICDRFELLANIKVYVKKVLRFAPVFGWSWKFNDVVFLERDWEKDRQSLGKQLTRLVNNPNCFWLTLFPEGTRLTPEKHARSNEVAQQKGLVELKHHLIPRSKGFTGSLPYIRKNVPAVYDMTLAFRPEDQNKPTVLNMLCGKPLVAHFHMLRFPIEDVPENEAEAANWLQKLYQTKDKLLDNFKTTGKFNPTDGENFFPEYAKFVKVTLPKRKCPLIIITLWTLLILPAILYYLFAMLTSGSYIQSGLVITFTSLAYLGMNNLINLTKIDKSSSKYGKEN